MFLGATLTTVWRMGCREAGEETRGQCPGASVGLALRPLRRRKARSPLLKLPWTGASAPVQGEEDLGWQLGDREEAMALRAAPSRAPSYLARFPQDASALRAPSALSPDQGQHGLCGVPGLRE